MALTLIDACRQLARHWEDRAAFDGVAATVSFCEAADTAASRSVFACALPPAKERLAASVSLIPAPGSAGDEDGKPIVRATIEATARAATPAAAVEFLAGLRTALRPAELPSRVAPYGGGAVGGNMHGVVGLPPFAELAAGGDVWRFIEVEILSQPSALSAHLATEEGQAEAAMTLGVMLVRKTLAAPSVAFKVHHDGSGSATNARIDLRGPALTLSVETDGAYAMQAIDLAASATDTVGELRAAIAALDGWTVSDVDAAHDARLSTALLRIRSAGALGSGNKVSFGLIG